MKRDTILIVDDQEVNRVLLKEIFQDTYQIIEAEDGDDAMKILEEDNQRLNVVLLDIIMPRVDGFEVLEYMMKKSLLGVIPVVFITGDFDPELEKRGFDMGVSDFITKPIKPQIVFKRVENLIDLYLHKHNLERLVDVQTEKIQKQAKQMQEQAIETLSSVVEFRNTESGQHIIRIKGFTRIMAEQVRADYPEYELDDNKIDMIVQASQLHDIGKIAIPDNILLKPGKLTAEEFEIMKSHSAKGGEMLTTLSFIKNMDFYEYCYEICRHHHEKYDGKGYPDGLKEEEISIAAQIVSVADVYDALVSNRVYKAAFTLDTAYNMIVAGECGVFNPKLLKCLEKVKPQFEMLAMMNKEEDAQI